MTFRFPGTLGDGGSWLEEWTLQNNKIDYEHIPLDDNLGVQKEHDYLSVI